MLHAFGVGGALFLVGFIAWTSFRSGVSTERGRRDQVLRRLTAPATKPRPLPFEDDLRRRVPADLGTTHPGRGCPDGASVPERPPRPGSLTHRLQLAEASRS